jgi:class 3 adenylate cyclase
MGSLAPIPLRRELRLACSPAELWPLISNTERFNRAIGLPAVKVTAPAPGEYAKRVSTRLLGIPLSWREPPFEWVEGHYFRVVREFESGPIERFAGGMSMTADGTGTKILVDYTFTPKNALGTFIINHATGKRSIEDAEAMLKRFDASVADGSEAFPERRTKTPPNTAAVADKAEALHESPVDRTIASALLHFVDHAFDDELGRMRPFELADRWGFDRLQTLAVFLHATKAGLLDMTWEVLCPNCAGANQKPGTLSELKSKAHCGSCEVEYGVNFDESVELRFAVSPTIRTVESHTFCAGSPAHAPFAVAQVMVPPGAPREEELELAAESFVLRELEGKRRVALRPAADGLSELRLDLASLDGEVRFKPGRVRLVLAPRATHSFVRLERESWKEKGATASLVTSLQEFRDLFSSEVLAPGVEMGVRTVALLFTDLKGSTALYEQIGDAAAYAIVRDHFDYLFAIIKERHGAVVKTIGDAVMAVFSRPQDAVEAALEMQERVMELNQRLSPKPAVILKIGVHSGPLIAINGDGVLDYFGTTVNIAARVQNESAGGDIIITDTTYKDRKVGELISAHGARQEPLRLRLKGLSDEYALWRLLPRA